MATADTREDPEEESPHIHFEPIVQLPLIKAVNYEEGEDELFQMRAKLFRFDKVRDPPEWKERGTGTVKLLRNQESQMIRVVMRRDKTFKTCANHYVQPEMELKPNCGSDKAWVWTTPADYADGEAKSEMLAIRFANAENALKFKDKFEECQKIMAEIIPKHNESVQKNGVPDSDEEDNSSEEGSGDAEKSADTKTSDKSEEAKDVTEKLENLTVKDSEKKDSEKASETDTKDTGKEQTGETTGEKKD